MVNCKNKNPIIISIIAFLNDWGISKSGLQALELVQLINFITITYEGLKSQTHELRKTLFCQGRLRILR